MLDMHGIAREVSDARRENGAGAVRQGPAAVLRGHDHCKFTQKKRFYRHFEIAAPPGRAVISERTG